ncbi:MAG: FAD-binding oxidoreductase [Sediminibacterium sp.]|jgi:glycine/D-amino acid oxidase-like deaminating enzyme|nr:FAD-binding oxidoreductase [Sediminibacterium sp.]
MAISVWEQSTYFSPKDLVIVGCGFVGLWTAYEAIHQNPKLNITILERGTIPSGASTRNAGFSCFGSVSELISDIQLMGETAMLETVKMRYDGLQRIQEVFKAKEIDYNQWGGYELFEGKKGAKNDESGLYDISKLESDIAYLNKILAPALKTPKKNGKYLPIYTNASKDIKKLGFQGIEALAFNQLEGQLNSAKLVLALQKAVQAKGVQILFNTEVKKFKSHKKGVTITTNLEAVLETKQFLVCTNGFAKQLIPSLDVVPARGQVFVTEPIKNLKFKGCFHFDEGYYYFRNLGNRLLLGGARNADFKNEKTYSLETSATIQKVLEDFMMQRILPKGSKKPKIELRWSGTMGMGSIKKPIIEQVQPNVYCAVRMSGMGVAIAPIVAKKALKLMKG